jgi:hypothetical protein
MVVTLHVMLCGGLKVSKPVLVRGLSSAENHQAMLHLHFLGEIKTHE